MSGAQAVRSVRGVMAAIEIQGLTKRFGKVHAVTDLSFTVEAGRVTGFLGPNGAGKSTTLRMLLGLIRPDAGDGRFGGQRYGAWSARRSWSRHWSARACCRRIELLRRALR